jgi:crotonobetainyl-CoA:carnitine CoA-transferase CaiB-like acyl-CoA transferase
MERNKNYNSILAGYRVLDLTEGGCLLGGRLLGDLGADVIQIEPPGGSGSRVGPFYKDIPETEKSLFWMAYCANKRGITLDIKTPEGHDLFKKLAKSADIILESFSPGFMDRLKLGYNDICRLNPDIIYAAVTPFGQKGPKASYKASELTIWASGGYLHACGYPERPPVWISFPQAALFGGAEAAIGALTALYYRWECGQGQYVDVSMQEAAISPNMNILQMWDVNKVEFHRTGGRMYVPSTGVSLPIYFKCKDGYVMILLQGGTEPFTSSSARLIKWMEEEGAAPEWLKQLNWTLDYDAAKVKQETADTVWRTVEQFTLARTKLEIYKEGAIRRQILIAPVSSTGDIAGDSQLQARNYWQQVDHPELKERLSYCGSFMQIDEAPIKYLRRAPLIGEHNREIYSRELNLTENQMSRLRETNII